MPDVTFPTTDGELPGYLSVPLSPSPWPGVVVIMDALGLSADIRAQADRLAASGYLALAPDLLARGGGLRCVAAAVRSSRTGTGPAYGDIESARKHLAAREDCTGGVGVIGFCMGGGFALLSAPQFPFAVASVNYGYVPKDLTTRAVDGMCPVVGSFGARDVTLRRHAARLETALRSLGVPHDVKEYADVGHSFLNHLDTGPLTPVLGSLGFGYDEKAADDAWRRILDFFDQYLREPVARDTAAARSPVP